MPMPPSGAARPSFRASNIAPASPPGLSLLITLPTEPTVSIRPQKVPSRPRKTSRPGHVARHVARLVEAGRDRIEDAAHHLRGDRHAADAVAEQRRHRRQQHRRALDREAGIGEPEAVDPVDLGEQPDHLPEREQDADQQHADDQRVEAGIGEEGRPDLLVEHDHDERAQDQEHQHPDQKNPGRGQLERIEVLRHGLGQRVLSRLTIWHRRGGTRKHENGEKPGPNGAKSRRAGKPGLGFGPKRHECHGASGRLRAASPRGARSGRRRLFQRASRSRWIVSLPATISPLVEHGLAAVEHR